MPSREATHAGSWYSDHEPTLSNQLDKWLAQVPDQLPGIGHLPVPGARIIIAPYALVSSPIRSAPQLFLSSIALIKYLLCVQSRRLLVLRTCAAWAYKALDLSQ
ncbi:hypothetical protein ACJ72_05807, partial [Emergomyces africanus]